MPSTEKTLLGNRKIYTIPAIVPANTTGFTVAKNIDGAVLFHCREIAGVFTTIEDVAGVIVDNGVCKIELKIVEGGTDYQFMDQPVSADMILSPGRKKSSLATNNGTNDPVNAVYSRLPFVHDFTKRIEVLLNNNSNKDQELKISFLGYEEKNYTTN